MPLTSVDVANMALAVLDEATIDSLDDDDRAARLLNLHYDTTREAELTKHVWSFSVLFPDDIAAVDTGQGGEFRYLYTVPSDFLRPAWLTADGTPTGAPITWSSWADGIRTDFEGPLKLPYVANLIDPDDWNALFTDVLAAALAIKIALPITHKANMVQLAKETYKDALEAALQVNAIMRIGKQYVGSWAQQRGDYRHWR